MYNCTTCSIKSARQFETCKKFGKQRQEIKILCEAAADWGDGAEARAAAALEIVLFPFVIINILGLRTIFVSISKFNFVSSVFEQNKWSMFTAGQCWEHGKGGLAAHLFPTQSPSAEWRCGTLTLHHWHYWHCTGIGSWNIYLWTWQGKLQANTPSGYRIAD